MTDDLETGQRMAVCGGCEYFVPALTARCRKILEPERGVPCPVLFARALELKSRAGCPAGKWIQMERVL